MLLAIIKEIITTNKQIMCTSVKTLIKVIIKQKLNDLPSHITEQIINETNSILFQFNKINLNKRKSFFSYSFMF